MSAQRETGRGRPRVVVLGGGFAGIGAAKNLKSDVDVVLVDKHDYHTFQPLLYQVATGLLEQPAVGHPIRDLFHKQDNVRIHQDRVTEIELDAREVSFNELEPARYDYLDGDGRPTLSYAATNETPKKELYGQLRSMLHKLHMEPDHLFHRFAYLKNQIPVAGCAHQAGTCRMGADAADSVVNTDCRAHELDNLYVVDTSVFPSIGAVNRALTAMANSLRVGDHLLGRIGTTAEAAAVSS